MATALLRCGAAAVRHMKTYPVPKRNAISSFIQPTDRGCQINKFCGSRYLFKTASIANSDSDHADVGFEDANEGDSDAQSVPVRTSGTASGIPPIRFGKRDRTREIPTDLATAFAEIRKQARWNQTVEVVVKVSTYDKNKKKGKPRDPFRGLVVLPHTFKAAKRIAVLATGEDADAASAAGAAVVGDQDLLPKLASGEVAFDVLLSTIPLLQPAKKFGRQLGRAMPSVKRGTAGEDVAGLVREHLAGIPYKMDASGRVACGFGKTSQQDGPLTDNLTAFLQSVETNRLSPQGKFILACRVSSAQTRTSFLLDLTQFQLTP
eukprot:m.209332 g.209332  ORF g.209332 m.209332 type:complete len:320 (-) comp18976_c0_seq1:374-1333(-)